MPHCGCDLPGKGKPAQEGHSSVRENRSKLFGINEIAEEGEGSITVVILSSKAWSSLPSIMGIYL